MTEEIWRDIEGFEGLYMISDMGGVKSLDYRHTGKENYLKPVKNKDGYLMVSLWENSKHKWFFVHRLVATAFIDNPDNKPCIDHINTIRDDNRVDNLRWVTAKENSDNPISRKRYLANLHTVGKFGKDNYNSKPVYQYSLDDKLIRKWDSMMDVQRELGFDQGNISLCCLGRIKTSRGYKWKYA